MTHRGWSRARIAELGEVQAGRQRAPQYQDGKLRPYLRVANVFDGYIDTTDILRMAFSDEEFARYRLLPGDILLNEGQSIELVGRCAIYPGNPPDCCFQNTLIRFRSGPNILSRFAELLFQHLQYTGTFARVALQTTSVAHLGVNRFASLKVTVPPVEEQRRIEKVLSAWGRAISTTSTLLVQKQLVRRCLIEQLLTGKRRQSRWAASEWTQLRLGDLFAERHETNCEDLPLLSITADRGVIPRAEIERKDSSSENKSAYKRIMPGDIGYNTMRMWQGVSAFSRLEGIVSPAYTICVPNDLIDGEFAAFLFKCPPVVNLFRRYSQGLVDDTLSLKFHNFAQIKVTVPTIAEQRWIASVLSTVDKELRLLRAYLDGLRLQKQALAGRLLTGQIRLQGGGKNRAVIG